jgi:hypothetical protein
MAAKSRSKKVTSSKISTKKSPAKGFSIDRPKLMKYLITILVVVLSFTLIDLFVQYLNNGYSMAVVNGVRIPKSDFYDRLEKAQGAQAAETLIEEELIEQEATRQGYTVSESDIDERIQQIQDELGSRDDLNAALDANGITMDDLRRSVRLDLLAREVLEPGIEYTEEDIKEFFDQYKDVLYTEDDVKFEDKKEEVTQYYLNQKIDEAKTAWLAELKADAKIQNNITDEPSYGFLKVTTNIVNNLLEAGKQQD